MIALLWQLLRAIARGERASLRVRVKPSWSARVYGTYAIRPRHLLFAAVFVLSAGAALLRLAALNLAEPAGGREGAALLGMVAHRRAVAAVRQPARLAELEAQVEETGSLAHRLHTMLGTHESGVVHGGGLGNLEDTARGADLTPPPASLQRLQTEVAVMERSFRDLRGELLTREDEFRFTPSIVPLFQAEFVPTSGFGPRLSPFTRLPEVHRGQDLAADMRSKIIATADGVVVHVEQDDIHSRMGRYVVLDHAGRYLTYYGHCERIFVRVGDAVTRHQIIAEVGNTGRSTGPHVHYEVRVAGEPQDPRRFMVFDPHFSSEEQIRVE